MRNDRSGSLRVFHIELWLLAGCRFSLGPCVSFLDAGRLSAQIAEVVKLSPANSSSANDIDVVDHRSVQRKDPLNANAETDLSDGYRFPDAAVLSCNADAFKSLQPFLIAFLDPDVNAKRITRLEVRNIFLYLCIFYNV